MVRYGRTASARQAHGGARPVGDPLESHLPPRWTLGPESEGVNVPDRRSRANTIRRAGRVTSGRPAAEVRCLSPHHREITC